MRLAVCWKHVTLGGPGGGDVGGDTRWSGVSPADEAALELALTLRAAIGSEATVTVVALGPPAADEVLRAAVAVGADRAIRIDASTALDGAIVAGALAGVLAGSDLVWCGDYSLDRGTASVPAFLADGLGAAQALGLVGVGVEFRPGSSLRVVRRLDGGRREVLDVSAPAVLSVEGSVATLRRAGLAAALASRDAPIEVIPGPPDDPEAALGTVRPYRPRARVLAPPVGGTLARVRDILDIGSHEVGHSETVTLDPPAAAARILDQLREWGYLGADGDES